MTQILLLEAFFVGLYCLALYTILSKIIFDYYTWFILGFTKHFAGYILGVHDYFCVYGNACRNKNKRYADSTYLIFDSMCEGILFLIIASLWMPLFTNKQIGIFLAGFFIHLLMEFLFVHTYFCNHRCS